MKIVFCSLRGSPGVTTLAVLCAARWPNPCVLLEADLAGGVLANRYGLPAGPPSLMSFAVAARHELTEEAIWSACRQLPDGVAAVVASEKPEEVSRGLEQLSLSSAPDSPDLLIDGGRFLGGQFTGGIVTGGIGNLEADAVIVVANPILEQLNPLISLAPEVVYEAQLGVVLAGKGPYHASEVAEQLQKVGSDRAFVLGSVPHDPKGAMAAVSEGPNAPITRRTRLYKAVGSVVKGLAGMRTEGWMADEELAIQKQTEQRTEVLA